MNHLPVEIETNIWNSYYSTIYYEQIFGHFRRIEGNFERMDTFLHAEFYPNKGRDYDKQIAPILRQFNEDLCNLFEHDKGAYLYMNSNRKLSFCFDKRYLQTGFPLVAPCYLQICIYCLFYGEPFMSYYIMERFVILSKNITE